MTTKPGDNKDGLSETCLHEGKEKQKIEPKEEGGSRAVGGEGGVDRAQAERDLEYFQIKPVFFFPIITVTSYPPKVGMFLLGR